MSTYLSSNNIKIFPFGSNRPNYDPYGRALNEQNISQIVKSIVDKPSYVIEYASDKIKFVINGYYCDCDISTLSNIRPLYAGIILKTYTDPNSTNSSNSSYTYVSGTDDTNHIFYGVAFGSDSQFSDLKKDGTSQLFTLQLLDKAGNVPADSYLKFNDRSISGISSYKVINCGSSKEVLDE